MTTVSIPGVDYAWSHPGGSALEAAGMKFAARYLSNGASKNISRAEADDLAEHGVWSVVVWESTATRPLSGRAAGVTDAQRAAAQAAAAGMPDSRPIYFAVDFDATAKQMPVVMAYLDGAASVLGRDRTGVYGGYDTVRAALDGRHATWAWQTRAWSEGRWDSRAHMRQGATRTIGGVSCDLNTATTADYGQWMPGRTPNITPQQEDDMTPDQDARLKRVETALADLPHSQWAYRNADMAKKNPAMPQAYGYLIQTNAAVKGLTAQVAALTATVGALATKGGLTAAEITAAAQAGAQAALAELGDALTPDTTKEN